VIVRTERGRSILRQAVEAGYIHLTPSSAESVIQAQTNLLSRRRELFGRLAAMRMLNIPTPRFTNFLLLRSWLRLSFQRRVATVFGTLRRAVVRRWYRRREYKPELFRGQDVQ
jgi:coenzyme F420 hydrogenase subunit beta